MRIQMPSSSALSLRLLAVVALAAGTTVVRAPGPADVAAAPLEPPPIRVLATLSTLPDGTVRYSYELINGSTTPISLLRIGDSYWGENELFTWPPGATADTLPPTSATSPPGWEVMLITTEERAGFFLDWMTRGAIAAIPPGAAQGGFSVTLAQPDTAYATCSWTILRTNGEEFRGVLQDSAAEADDFRIIPGSPLVGMRQESGRVAWEFRWQTSGMTDAERDTVWIDAETCGCGGPRVLTAGLPQVSHGITSYLQSAIPMHWLQWWSDCCATHCQVTFRVAGGTGKHAHVSGSVAREVTCRGRD